MALGPVMTFQKIPVVTIQGLIKPISSLISTLLDTSWLLVNTLIWDSLPGKILSKTGAIKQECLSKDYPE